MDLGALRLMVENEIDTYKYAVHFGNPSHSTLASVAEQVEVARRGIAVHFPGQSG
jgi:hypothetical protein